MLILNVLFSEREKGKCVINNINFSENIICEPETVEVIQVCNLNTCIFRKKNYSQIIFVI